MLQLRAKVRAGLLSLGKFVSQAAQVIEDIGTITEEPVEELYISHHRDRPMQRVMKAVERIGLVRLDEKVQQARHSERKGQSDDADAEENNHGKDQRIDIESRPGDPSRAR